METRRALGTTPPWSSVPLLAGSQARACSENPGQGPPHAPPPPSTKGEMMMTVSGDLKLDQYRRFENVVFSSWNPYMKFVFWSVFFVSHVFLMGCNSHIREPQQI